jgi:BMFP domain-containing protein YqiC
MKEYLMQTQNRFLDDFARVATGAMGAVTGMRGELEARVREQFERVLGRMNLVRRDEFDAVQAMAAKARAAQEMLEKRLAVLEAKLGIAAPAPAKSAAAPRRRTAPRAKRRSAGRN